MEERLPIIPIPDDDIALGAVGEFVEIELRDLFQRPSKALGKVSHKPKDIAEFLLHAFLYLCIFICGLAILPSFGSVRNIVAVYLDDLLAHAFRHFVG